MPLRPVALDAMGGDHAPEATVAGAVRAAADGRHRVILVGDKAQLEAELRKHGPTPAGIEISHAPRTIGMEESPGPALLRKRDASIVVATDLVRDGRACGVVSAGNSGAAMGAAALRLGLLPGLDRPAIAMMMPNRGADVIVLDGGATVDSRPEHLRDFGLIGSTYAEALLHIERPRVGLLNIGTEESKGNAAVKQAYSLLKAAPVNFVGYVEGQHIALGDADVVVCDGFVGNALLKTIEGYAELFWALVKKAASSSLRGRLGAWLLRPALHDVAEKLDYVSYGGALLVGVKGICVIGHGRSSSMAVANAIRVAAELDEQGVVDHLMAAFARTDGEAVRAAVGHENEAK
jgi:glycerol-3-phosphate acyltransferase PlsX